MMVTSVIGKSGYFRLLLVGLWVVLFLSGCNYNPIFLNSSFITAIVAPDTIMRYTSEGPISPGADFRIIREGDKGVMKGVLKFRGKHYDYDAPEYIAYQKIFNDLHYNLITVNGGVDNWGCIARLNKISVVCDKAFNTEYPAGAELAPITSVIMRSYAEFIENNYKGAEYKLRTVRASSSADLAGLKLYDPRWTICFDSYPEGFRGKTANLTIKFFSDSAGVSTGTFRVMAD